MVRVRLMLGESQLVGDYDFAAVPRVGEVVSVPSPADDNGVRIFQVDEVMHYAAGLALDEALPGPSIELRTSEIE